MSKEKQMIEELADFLWRNTLIHTEDLCHDVAETIITEGYRKQSEGEWRIDQHGNGWCSVCNHCGFLEEEDSTDYCPNCGAKMKGGE